MRRLLPALVACSLFALMAALYATGHRSISDPILRAIGVGPHDFLATLYRHLGIDYERITIPDRTGRPIPIVSGGRAIPELVAAS